MIRGEHFIPYVTTRTFADPTAREAVRNINHSLADGAVGIQNQSDLATRIRILSDELRGLNQRRVLKEITRREYTALRTPLVTDYHALLQVHLARKGNKLNGN